MPCRVRKGLNEFLADRKFHVEVNGSDGFRSKFFDPGRVGSAIYGLG